MTEIYWERVKKTLFRYSNEEKDINQARREWRYFGDVEDNRVSRKEQEAADRGAYPSCELCNHPEIRFSFIIRNIENDHELKVGSECITKFIEVDANGEVIRDPIKKREILKKGVRKLIRDNKTKEVIKNILAIQRKDQTFDAKSFLDRLDTRNGFTIKQIKLLFFLFKKYNISYWVSNYKVNLRRKREQQQLMELKEWQFNKLKPIIPKRFQEKYVSEN